MGRVVCVRINLPSLFMSSLSIPPAVASRSERIRNSTKVFFFYFFLSFPQLGRSERGMTRNKNKNDAPGVTDHIHPPKHSATSTSSPCGVLILFLVEGQRATTTSTIPRSMNVYAQHGRAGEKKKSTQVQGSRLPKKRIARLGVFFFSVRDAAGRLCAIEKKNRPTLCLALVFLFIFCCRRKASLCSPSSWRKLALRTRR
jgi:hypothetical protein